MRQLLLLAYIRRHVCARAACAKGGGAGLMAGLRVAASVGPAASSSDPPHRLKHSIPLCAPLPSLPSPAGGYVLRSAKLPQYIVPDLSGFKVGAWGGTRASGASWVFKAGEL